MFRSSIISAVIGAIATLMFAMGADALRLTVAKSQATAESNITLVRDGCGPGMRYSSGRQTCVEDNRGPGPGGRGYGVVDRRAVKEACQARCLERREMCNQRKGGYFNGCGIQGAA